MKKLMMPSEDPTPPSNPNASTDMLNGLMAEAFCFRERCKAGCLKVEGL
jgi:hypothetical protein